jgi:glycosyltransferase involved in cell wall biosynthesis
MEPGSDPTVSIIIPTRNRPDRLEVALQSVAAQSFRDFESIVVDDGSGDAAHRRYEEIWKKLDSRFVLLTTATGAPGTGPADARNRGLGRASGKFVAFLDDDDEWITTDHLHVGLNALQEHDADLFFANMQGHRRENITVPRWFDYTPFLETSKPIAGPPWVYEVSLRQLAEMLRHRPIHANLLIVRRDLVHHFGGFMQHAWMYEDWNFCFRMADVSRKILYRPDVVANYRLPQDDSVSRTVSRLFIQLQKLNCAHELRVTCRNRYIRKHARAMESATYQFLSKLSLEKRAGHEAISLAWNGLSAYPTLGALAFLAKTIVRGLGRGGGDNHRHEVFSKSS